MRTITRHDELQLPVTLSISFPIVLTFESLKRPDRNWFQYLYQGLTTAVSLTRTEKGMGLEKSISEQVAELYRSESRRVLATLIRLLGDFDLAEEALQEAFRAALD